MTELAYGGSFIVYLVLTAFAHEISGYYNWKKNPIKAAWKFVGVILGGWLVVALGIISILFIGISRCLAWICGFE